MVGYTNNNTRDMYNLYNPETKRIIMTRYVKWAYRKMTNPAEALKMLQKANKQYLLPGIEKGIIPTSEPEDKMPVQVISD